MILWYLKCLKAYFDTNLSWHGLVDFEFIHSFPWAVEFAGIFRTN